MKRHASFLAVMLAVASVGQADTRIAFSTDQEGTFDIFKTNESGSFFHQVTDVSLAEQHPTIDPSGTKVVYHIGGALFMSNFKDPISDPIPLGTAYDPSAARVYLNPQRDFRVMYHKGDGDHLQIYIATIDISEGVDGLINEVQLTDANVDSTQPAFCGSSHFVWIRNDGYGGELCYQEFNAQGAVGDKTCWFDGYGDRMDEHPSCDSTGGTITWARETENPGTGYEGTHDIWTMTSGGSNPHAIQDGLDDETMPVWARGDESIAFAWNRVWGGGESHDYEIWTMDPDGTGDLAITENDGIDDTYPSWGPAAP